MHSLSLTHPFSHPHTSQTNSPRVNYFDPSRILCDRPSTRPGVYIGELSTDVQINGVSGEFYVVDEYKLYIQLFNFRPGECTGTRTYAFLYPQS